MITFSFRQFALNSVGYLMHAIKCAVLYSTRSAFSTFSLSLPLHENKSCASFDTNCIVWPRTINWRRRYLATVKLISCVPETCERRQQSAEYYLFFCVKKRNSITEVQWGWEGGEDEKGHKITENRHFKTKETNKQLTISCGPIEVKCVLPVAAFCLHVQMLGTIPLSIFSLVYCMHCKSY